MERPDSVYHLSHTDLDGYACQFLTSKCFEKIVYQNSNYGDEITARLKIFFDRMLLDNADSIMLLVTDLNLTVQQCAFIDEQMDRLRQFKSNANLSVVLLDHHGSGKEAAAKYAWYFLDTSRSATKITYDWLLEHFDCEALKKYEKLVEAVNAVDIWLSDRRQAFEFGKVLMGGISNAREVGRTLFDDEDRAQKFHIIESAREYIDRENAHIELDKSMHGIKKSFFTEEKDDTLDNLVADYLTKLLTESKDRLKIRYDNHIGILTYGIPNISVIGNAFLVRNPDIDFIMNVSPNGSMGLRSDNRADVSEIAATLVGGGGHPNAGGGRIPKFRECYRYEDVKRIVENLIEEKRKENP